MSYYDLNDRGSGHITAATISLAIITVPVSALAALFAVIVWSEFSGSGLINRLICLSSPIFAFACLTQARKANRRGDHLTATLYLGAITVPLILLLGLVTWAVVQ